MRTFVLAALIAALPASAFAQASAYEHARRFPWFDYQQITKIKNLEAQGNYEQAYSVVRDTIKEKYPAPYSKGLEEKCRRFASPVECEVAIVRRLMDDDYKNAMDGIYNSVK